MDWNRTEVVELINHYRLYECLWDSNCEEYTNPDLKKNAWLEIADACGKELEEVKRKVKYLRTAYVAEKKKVDASKEQDRSYQPNLFYYKDFDFLDTVVVLRKSSLPPAVSSPFVRRTSPIKRKHKTIKQVDRKGLRDTKFNNAVDAIVAAVTTPVAAKHDNDNLFTSFGKTAALQLQQLPLDMATQAMSEIYSLVAKKTLDRLKNLPLHLKT